MMNQSQLSQAFRAGDLTADEYISRMEGNFSSREPEVLSFIPEEKRFERLREEAESLVARYPVPKNRPLLFGMTLGVKDIYHVDGFTTQAGSRLPAQDLQGGEAVSVRQLKDAGVLVMGKTVTTEFAYFTPGPTRNPHNPEHTPGGSSSGSAAAIGAGLCDLTLGTQTIGSVVRPAAFCGAVGFKPTYERISREGVIPLSPTLDHIGFFTSDILTASLVASVLIRDWRLVLSEAEGSDTPTNKPILGIPDGPYLSCAADYALSCFNDLCDSLAQAGYDLRRVRAMDDFQQVRDRHDVIMSFDASQVHKEWFAKYESLYSQKFSDLIRRGQKITDHQLQNALEARQNFRDRITKMMQDNNIDLWICPPTIGPAPKGLDSTGDPVMCLPWTQIGFPAIHIPTTKNEDGLPMGLQVVGNWNLDEALFQWCVHLEEVVRTI